MEPAPEELFQNSVSEPLPESGGFGKRLGGFLRRPAFASVVGVLLLLIILISRLPSPTGLKVQRVTDKYHFLRVLRVDTNTGRALEE